MPDALTIADDLYPLGLRIGAAVADAIFDAWCAESDLDAYVLSILYPDPA